jgi:hypothetical protein
MHYTYVASTLSISSFVHQMPRIVVTEWRMDILVPFTRRVFSPAARAPSSALHPGKLS